MYSSQYKILYSNEKIFDIKNFDFLLEEEKNPERSGAYSFTPKNKNFGIYNLYIYNFYVHACIMNWCSQLIFFKFLIPQFHVNIHALQYILKITLIKEEIAKSL